MIKVKRKAPVNPPIESIKLPCLINNKDVLTVGKADKNDYEISICDYNCVVVSKKTLAELGALLIELSKQ